MSKQAALDDKSVSLSCPYCDMKFSIVGDDIFVILGRLGICFVNCKRCGQTMGVDDELGYSKSIKEE